MNNNHYMLEKIINSKVRLAVLAFLFSNVEKKRYAQEIINAIKLDPANVHKELDNLVNTKVVDVESVGAKKFYSVNKDNDFFSAFKSLFEVYSSHQDLDKWFVLEEINNVHPSIASTYVFHNFNKRFFKKEFDINSSCQGLEIYEDGFLKLCFIRSEFIAFAKEVFNKLVADPDWGIRLNIKVKSFSDNWAEISRNILCKNLSQLTNEELWNLFDESYRAQIKSHSSGWPANTVDFENSMLSKYLVKILEDRKSKLGLSYSIGGVFSILTTPTELSYAQKEHQSLVKLFTKIYNSQDLIELFRKNDARIILEKLQQNFSEIFSDINEHQKAFGWLTYQYQGPGWDSLYFTEIIASMARQGINPDDLLEDVDSKEKKLINEQEKYFREFRLTESELKLFEVARGFVFGKGYRKDHMFFSMYCDQFLMKEIGRRTYLSLRQVRNMYPQEIKKALLSNEIDATLLNGRIKFHVFYSGSKGETFLNGEKARKFLSQLAFIEEKIEEVDFLEGDTASPGKVSGIVYKVNTPDDIKKMKQGGILVSFATSPDLVPAIKKAAAIITDMGGVTCHAAIISRELGIPCVIGTKIATKVLHDGDLVEVNASHGRVVVINHNKQ